VPPAKINPRIEGGYPVESTHNKNGAALKYFITGGAGFIGSNFVRMILNEDANAEILVIDNLSYAGNLKNLDKAFGSNRFKFHEADITDFPKVLELMADVDYVINFAAESHVDRSLQYPDAFIRTNVLGTEILLRASRIKNVKRFIQVSTDEVYGSVREGSSLESDVLLPNSPYSASKAAADLIVRSYVESFGIDACITRCCNNYGPNQHPEKLIPLFITNILRGKKVPIYGDGLNVREWIHVEDHCRGILNVLRNGKKGDIYNIGSDERLTNLEITQMLLAELSSGLESISYVQDRPGHDRRYALNSLKIVTELNFTVRHPFVDGLKSTVDWYKENQEWWAKLVSSAEDQRFKKNVGQDVTEE
jgi:dTDP-glucose 4,6-dehydratase